MLVALALLAFSLSSGAGLVVAFVALVTVGAAGFYSIKNESTKSARERIGDAKDETSHWRQSFQAENQRANALADELRETRDAKHTLKAERDAMALRTDLSGLMRQLTDQHRATQDRVDKLETRMNTRLDSFVAALDAVTTTLKVIANSVPRNEEDAR